MTYWLHFALQPWYNWYQLALQRRYNRCELYSTFKSHRITEEDIYDTSYCFYGAIGVILTMVISGLVSLLTGNSTSLFRLSRYLEELCTPLFSYTFCYHSYVLPLGLLHDPLLYSQNCFNSHTYVSGPTHPKEVEGGVVNPTCERLYKWAWQKWHRRGAYHGKIFEGEHIEEMEAMKMMPQLKSDLHSPM